MDDWEEPDPHDCAALFAALEVTPLRGRAYIVDGEVVRGCALFVQALAVGLDPTDRQVLTDSVIAYLSGEGYPLVWLMGAQRGFDFAWWAEREPNVPSDYVRWADRYRRGMKWGRAVATLLDLEGVG